MQGLTWTNGEIIASPQAYTGRMVRRAGENQAVREACLSSGCEAHIHNHRGENEKKKQIDCSQAVRTNDDNFVITCGSHVVENLRIPSSNIDLCFACGSIPSRNVFNSTLQDLQRTISVSYNQITLIVPKDKTSRTNAR